MTGFYWLGSYPKSGNTWLRAFLRNYSSGENDPVSINDLHTGFSTGDRAWLDTVSGLNSLDLTDDELDCLRPDIYAWYAANSRGTSFHKAHDAFGTAANGKPILGFPGLSGALYVLRNPFDVALSLADFLACSASRAVDLMCNPKASIGPVDSYYGPVRQKLDTWSQHVRSWSEASEIDLLVVRYEDLVQSPFDEFSKVVRFAGLDYDDDWVRRAIRFSSFNELQKQETQQGFTEMHAETLFFRHGSARRTADNLSDELKQKLIARHGPVMKKFGYL